MISIESFSDELQNLYKEAGIISGLDNAAKFLGSRVLKDGTEVMHLGKALGRTGLGAATGAGVQAIRGEDAEGIRRGALTGGIAASVTPSALRTLANTGRVAKNIRTEGVLGTLKKGWGADSRAAGTVGGDAFASTMKTKWDRAGDSSFLGRLWHGSDDAAVRANRAALEKRFGHLVDFNKLKTITNPEDYGKALVSSSGTVSPGLKGKLKDTAENLSRSGWTGSGNVTKYLPVGGKATTTGFAAMSAPTIYDSMTGKKPIHEGMGEIGSNLGMIAASSVPAGRFILPHMGNMMLSSEIGRGILGKPTQIAENYVKGQ